MEPSHSSILKGRSLGGFRATRVMISELKGSMRLEPIVGEHPAVVCIRCHGRISAGIIYVDTDTAMNEIYCRQCADEMACFPPYRTPRKATA